MLKTIAAAFVVASVAVMAENEGYCPEKECRGPCDPEPLAFEGLQPCAPVQQNGIVFWDTCKDCPRYGTAYSQAVIENCDVQCDFKDNPLYENSKWGWEAKGVCLSYDIYARPYCYDPRIELFSKDLKTCPLPGCTTDSQKECLLAGAKLAQVGCEHFAVIEVPSAFVKNCIQECPDNYYPACLLVKTLNPFLTAPVKGGFGCSTGGCGRKIN